METIENKELIGERAEYFAKDRKYSKVLFRDGESPLKHASNISVEASSFEYKYPMWNTDNTVVKNSTFHELGKSGLWYVKNMTIEDTVIHAPKEFRRSSGITLNNVNFTNAAETLWTCDNIRIKNVQAKNGDYFAMNSCNFYAENLTLDGNYFLDGGKNIEIHNSVLNSKDAFWNCENVYLENCTIKGEYFGWNSKNIFMKDCLISSHQGFCYMKNIRMENCRIEDSDLIFEYCQDIDCDIRSPLDSVKNPISGVIHAQSVKEMIRDDETIDLTKIHVYVQDGGKEHEI